MSATNSKPHQIESSKIEIESHPWPPFVPDGAKILIMGTFPPGIHRRSMEFFYPNRTNDFWYMMGLIFMDDKYALYDREAKAYRLDEIKSLLSKRGIAMGDTGHKVRRLRGNASDKYLEIIEPIHLQAILDEHPTLRTLATTGEKAAGVLANLTGTDVPKMGESVSADNGLTIWRMPSTSRAYPLALEKKAAYYKEMFLKTGVL